MYNEDTTYVVQLLSLSGCLALSKTSHNEKNNNILGKYIQIQTVSAIQNNSKGTKEKHYYQT